MSELKELLERNHQFSTGFNKAELPILPKLRTVILTCADARVDPAILFNLDLGESVVMRNTGGRVTQSIIEEIAALSFMVAKMDGDKPGRFELVIMHHTHCGVQRYADPDFQNILNDNLGIDVSSLAIVDHKQSLLEDIEKLKKSSIIPRHITVSGCIYDVKTGAVEEVFKPTSLEKLEVVI